METPVVLNRVPRVPAFFLSLFGIGLVPRGAGTLASAVWALALLIVTIELPDAPALRATFLFLLIVLVSGVALVCLHLSRTALRDAPDRPWIVLDEAAGMTVAAIPVFFLAAPLVPLLAAFALFRFFDIVKPLGIARIDRRSDVASVLLDDLLAGIYAGAVTAALFFL